ncbi:SMC family ATPase [archaeon]|nr:SMC family ATPase [archaeon]
MIIKSVQMKNIRSYEDEKVEFPLGSTLLAGDIGTGKSTILLAIDFAFFGFRKGELSGSDMLRHGKDRGSVKVNFELEGKNISIERTIKRGKDSFPQDNCIMNINETTYEMTPVELKSKVLEMFGYPQDILKKNRPLFRFTVYTPQEHMKQILIDEEERLEILRNIFSIDKYGRIRSNGKIFVTELRAMKRECEAVARDIDIDKKRLEEFIELQMNASADLDTEKNKLNSINARVDSVQERLSAMKTKFNEINNAKHLLTKKESDIRSKQVRTRKLEEDAVNFEAKITKNIEELDRIGNVPSAAEIKTRMLELEKMRDRLVSEKAILNNEVKNLDKIYSDGVCTTCGQKVFNPSDFRNNIDEKISRIKEIDSSISAINNDTAMQKDLLPLSERRENIKHSHDDFVYWKNEAAAEKGVLTIDIKNLHKEILDLEEKTAGFETISAEISAIDEEARNIQIEKTFIEKNVSRIEQQIRDAEKNTAETRRTIEKKEGMREKAAMISDIIGWFEPFTNLMESIEKSVLYTVQKQFNEHFQKWFSIIMEDQLSVRITGWPLTRS